MEELIWQTEVLLQWLEPTALAERRRNETFDFVKDVLQNHIIEASVYMTGSFPLKTYLPDSDIDIMLCIPEAKQGCGGSSGGGGEGSGGGGDCGEGGSG